MISVPDTNCPICPYALLCVTSVPVLLIKFSQCFHCFHSRAPCPLKQFLCYSCYGLVRISLTINHTSLVRLMFIFNVLCISSLCNLFMTWSSPRRPLRSYSLVCNENHLFIVGLGSTHDKEL